MSRTRVIPFAVALLMVTAMTTIAGAAASPARKYLTGTVRIGVSGSLPGWSYPSDDPDGFDVALARFLQHKYKFDMELVPVRPADRERALRTGEVKLVIADFPMTAPKPSGTDFAGPYFRDRSGVMFSWTKLDDATGSEPGLPANLVCVPYERADDCFDELLDKNDLGVVGVRTDEAVMQAYARKRHTTVSPALWEGPGHPTNDEEYGIGLPGNSPDLCRELDSAIDEFLASPDGWQKAFNVHLAAGMDPAGHKPPRSEPERCG
jgi:glutamate transport system substrate-binding protein